MMCEEGTGASKLLQEILFTEKVTEVSDPFDGLRVSWQFF
jgi:hypothetical protein